MDEEQRAARRKALADQIAQMKRQGGPSSVAPPAPVEEEEADELDWEIEPGADSVATAAPESDPDVDSGWEDEKEEKEIEAAEAALPDEKFDPVAYAAAKKAIEERKAARREKKRSKDAAKKAKREARAREARAKQKGKKPKPRLVQTAKTPAPKSAAKASRAAEPSKRERDEEGNEESSQASQTNVAKRKLSSNNWIVLGIVIAVFVAALTYAALHAR